MSKLNIGIIGVGGIANSHLRDIVQSTGLWPYAICDVDTQALNALGEKYGIAAENRFKNQEGLLACPGVDAVVIATPNFNHYPAAMAAIRVKKPFALEKPIGITEQEAREIMEATQAAQLPNMVCFSYRFWTALRYAKAIVESGELGKIRHVYGQYIQGIPEDAPRLWRYEKSKAGAGTLGDIGSHLIDMARFIVGELTEVAAHSGIIVKERPNPDGGGMLPVDVDDYFHFLATLEDDIAATFACTKFAFGRKNYQRFEVYGSKGALVFTQECTRGDRLEVCMGDVYERTGEFVPVSIPKEYEVRQVDAFQSVIEGTGGKLAATVEDGYRAQQIIGCLLESSQSRQWVHIK